MMRYISSLLFLLSAASVFGGNLSLDEARVNALDFMSARHSTSVRGVRAATLDLECVRVSQSSYIFNVEGGRGYVIASASDRMQPVLGYSDTGCFDVAHMPDALKAWLDELDEAVVVLESADTHNASPALSRSDDKPAIAPLVSSRWNQGSPYNGMTPSYVDQNSGQYNEHSATGCVATATTQIMYYWKWPQDATKTIPSYTYNWSGNSKTMPSLPPVVFDWASMKDTYGNNDSQASKDAVSQLMLYAGCGMKSGYAGATGATSVNAMNALKEYFGYTKKAFNVYHLNYTFQEWEDLLYNELAAGRPLLIGADNYERTGGHEFICDGYDGKGLYHINWGWGGWCDGYFVLTVMAPDSQGIGGSSDANGYSMGQNVIVNLRPEYSEDDNEIVRCAISAILPGQSATVRDADGNVSLYFSYNIRTLLLNRYEIEHGFVVYDAEGNRVGEPFGISTDTYNPADRYGKSITVRFGAGLADGEYTLRGVSRRSGSSEWLDDMNSDRNNIALTVSSDKVQVSARPGKGTRLQVDKLTLEGVSVAGQWQRVKYTITNTGDDFYGETYMFVDGKRVSGNTISIRAGETADVYYKFQPDGTPGFHRFVLSRQTSATNGVISSIDKAFNIDCLWKADGTIERIPSTSQNYSLPSDVTAVYLTGKSPRTIGVPDANPNLIMYLDEDAVLSARVLRVYRQTISNIVYGDKAEVFRVKDGYELSVPRAFVAEEASYTRENIPAWSTLFLPFPVENVEADGNTVDWFTSTSDTGKSIFLKKFMGARRGTLIFAHSDAEIPAGQPLLVGVAGNLGGIPFDHTGSAVTFSAKNVTITTDGLRTVDNVSAASSFVGCISTKTPVAVMGLDETFANFVTTTDVEPFHAYFTKIAGYDSCAVRYDEGETSGIDIPVVENMDAAAPVYNLQGIRVGTVSTFGSLPAGLYIISGRKVLKR